MTLKRWLPAVGLLAIPAATGCYSYRTMRLEDVRPDDHLRVRVTPEATGHVARVMGYLTQDVDGAFVSLQQDSILLTVTTPTAPQARTIQRLYQRLNLPVSQIIEVQERSFSRGRTIACIGAGVAGAAGVAVWAFSGTFGGSTGARPPPTDNRVMPAPRLLPLGRLRLGR